MTEELEQTTIERVENLRYLDYIGDGKTQKYCFEFKVTWEYKFFLNYWTTFDGVYPSNISLEKIFLKDMIGGLWRDHFLELLGEMNSNPRMKRTTNIRTTDIKIVRSETEPTKLEWYFRISDFYNVKVDKGDKSHIEFLKSDKLKNKLKTSLTCTNFIDKSFRPILVLGCPTSVEVIYNTSYFTTNRFFDENNKPYFN